MRTVTLLGMGKSATGNLELIGEIWSLNNAYVHFKKLQFDRMFEIHDLSHARAHKPDGKTADHFERLNQLGCPIYMQEPVPEIPLSRRYPLEEVALHFGTNYFIGTPSYMLALAIYEGVNRLRVYGFDHADHQHHQQRQAWTFWMAKAQDAGIMIDGSHNWLGEVDIDAEERMNPYRDRAGRAIQKAVDEKRIVNRSILLTQPYRVAVQQEIDITTKKIDAMRKRIDELEKLNAGD
jgi:hypothetical protein